LLFISLLFSLYIFYTQERFVVVFKHKQTLPLIFQSTKLSSKPSKTPSSTSQNQPSSKPQQHRGGREEGHHKPHNNKPKKNYGPKSDRQAVESGFEVEIPTETSHPLESEWTFWYDRRPTAAAKRIRGERDQYESNLRPIGSFGTIEEFWRFYNHMVKPTRMEVNANYHLFKKGIKPLWEDTANAQVWIAVSAEIKWNGDS